MVRAVEKSGQTADNGLMPTLRGRRAALVTVVALAAIAGCSTPSYRYVNNTSKQTFFRVPRAWAVYDIGKSTTTDRPGTTSTSTQPWVKVIDGDPNPAVSHADLDYPASPIVRAEITSVTGTTFHDQISISNLRALATNFKIDPVDAVNTGDTTVEIVSYAELATKTGVHGVHLVFNWKKDGTHWVTIDHTAMLDAKANTLFLLEIRCVAACFKLQRDTISAISSSWQVRA